MADEDLGPREVHGEVRLTKGNAPVVEGVVLVLEGSPWAHFAEGRHEGLRGKVVTAAGTLRRRWAAPEEQAPEEGFFEYLSELTAFVVADDEV